MDKKLQKDKKRRHFTNNFWFVLTLIGLNLLISFGLSLIFLCISYWLYKTSLPDLYDLVLYNIFHKLGVPQNVIFLDIIIKYSDALYWQKSFKGLILQIYLYLISGGILVTIGLSHYKSHN